MRRKLSITILLLLMLCSIFAVGCGGDKNLNDKPITSGGKQEEETVVVEQIYDAVDLHIGTGVTESTLENGAYVLIDGVKYAASLDTENVVFGQSGEYDIDYSYGELKVHKKLYVYGAPTISGQSAVTLDYKTAVIDNAYGVTAKDSFQAPIPVLIADDDGMYNPDGSANVGTFNVKYIAYDNAGQSVTYQSAVTVNGVSGACEDLVYDLSEAELSVSVDQAVLDKMAFVSVNGCVIPNAKLVLGAGSLAIDTDYLKEVVFANEVYGAPKQDFDFRVVTNDGLYTSNFCLTNYDIGFTNGMVVSSANKLSDMIISDAQLNQVYVKELDSDNLVARYKTGEDFAAFENTVLALNESHRYVLQMNATKQGSIFSNEIHFTVAEQDASVLLGGKGANVLLKPYDLTGITTSALVYQNKEIDGIKGSYLWKPLLDEVKEYEGKLFFNVDALSGAQAGDVLSFKMKYSAAFNFSLTIGGRRYYPWSRYAWRTTSNPVNPATEGKWEDGQYKMYCGEYLTMYDCNGKKITLSDTVDPLKLKGYDNDGWITIEFVLPLAFKDGDHINIYAGTDPSQYLSNLPPIYFADMKITSSSVMQDATKNYLVDYYMDNQVEFEDIEAWQ